MEFTLEEIQAERRERFWKSFRETTQDAVQGFAQAATLGFGDEIAAVMLPYLGSGADNYDDALSHTRSLITMSAARSPIANTLGGVIGMAPAVTAGLIANTPRAIIAIEAGLGGVNGFGLGKGAKDSLQNGAFGALLGLGGAATGVGIQRAAQVPVGQKVANFFHRKATDAAKKASDANVNIVQAKVGKGKIADAVTNAGDELEFPSEEVMNTFIKAQQQVVDTTAGAAAITDKSAKFIDNNPLTAAAGAAVLGAAGVPLAGFAAKGLAAKAAVNLVDKIDVPLKAGIVFNPNGGLAIQGKNVLPIAGSAGAQIMDTPDDFLGLQEDAPVVDGTIPENQDFTHDTIKQEIERRKRLKNNITGGVRG